MYMHSEWQQRLKHWLNTLRKDLYLPLGPIDVEAFMTMDYLTPEEAQKLGVLLAVWLQH